MKGLIRVGTSFALIVLVSISVFGQTNTFEIETDNYHVISEIDGAHAEATADQLEAMLSLYNQQFRFPVEELDAPLRVRVFATKARYDAYLRRLVNESRQGFVYLHYRDVAKSELVGYYTEDSSLEQSMIHQSFVQFLRAFIPHPPLWIREGFAVYYEASVYDPEFGTAIYHENLAWLDTLKEIVQGESTETVIPLDAMLSMTIEEASNNLEAFYPQAWGMVSFLLNAEHTNANRILWDSLSALHPDADLSENIDAVYREAFRWVDQDQLVEDFTAYLDSRRSFRGWITYGIEQYETDEMDAAEQAFVRAIQLREDNYVPYYYLGLINYERQNFGLADFYYQEAIAKGAEEAITLYALGVNAYADNRFEDAVTYLEQTVDTDPSYREKAEDLLIRIRG